MNLLLASTSTLFGGSYLEYIKEEIKELFSGIDQILFVPYARPSGISHEEYTEKAREFFQSIGIQVKGIHEYPDPKEAIKEAKGYFTGGGNTFLLLKTLYDLELIEVLTREIKREKPYLGTSAGSNIAGQTIGTTNDMPIVEPSSFKALGLVPLNLNPHYLDPDPNLKHNGETRETRIKEFLTQNEMKVVGLREGNWIRRIGDRITLEGPYTSRIFEKGSDPVEQESGTLL